MVYACFDLNLFTSAAITFFAYCCQANLLPIYSELINPSMKRIDKVIFRSVFVDLAFYLIIALTGYFSTYNFTNIIVLERAPLKPGSTDYAILIAILTILVVIFVAVPVNYNPFRN